MTQYKINKKNKEYWEFRNQHFRKYADKQTDRIIRKVNLVYKEALRNIEREINNTLVKLVNDANKLDINKIAITTEEIAEYRNIIKALENRLGKINNDKALAYVINQRQRVAELNRLTTLRHIIALELTEAINYEEEQLRIHLEKLYQNGHTEATKQILDVSNVKYNKGLVSINPDAVARVVREPWNNLHYSDRIWRNTERFLYSFEKVISEGLSQNWTIERMSNILKQKENVKYYQAERLIRTETAYFIEDSHKEAYVDMGVEYYQFIATLDDRTRKNHAQLDNERFLYSQANQGVNYPPLAPNCRCSTIPYFPTNRLASKRIAKNKDGEYIYVSTDTKASEYNQIFRR